MKSVWRAGRVWLALLAMTTLAACETGDPLSTIEPRSTGTFEEFEASVVAQAEASGIDLEALPSEVPLMRAGGRQFVFVQGSAGDVAVEAVIGSRGGMLNLGSHWLLVPAGAVRTDVTFRMEPIQDGRYHVELTASDRGRDDNNVGRTGFRKPVYLAFNFGGECPFDPSALTVAWLTSSGSLVSQPTYIFDEAWAVGVLRHFSGYVLVAN